MATFTAILGNELRNMKLFLLLMLMLLAMSKKKAAKLNLISPTAASWNHCSDVNKFAKLRAKETKKERKTKHRRITTSGLSTNIYIYLCDCCAWQ